MAQRFPGDEDFVGLGEEINETGVELRRRVRIVRHVGLNTAVMLGEEVGTLGDIVHPVDGFLFPTDERLGNTGDNAVTPSADQTVRGPDAEVIAPIGLESVHIVLSVGLETGMERSPRSVPNIAVADEGERLGMLALGVNPEDGMGDVDELVTVEGAVDFSETLPIGVNECRQAFHVLVRTGDNKGTVLFRRLELPANVIGQSQSVELICDAEVILSVYADKMRFLHFGLYVYCVC